MLFKGRSFVDSHTFESLPDFVKMSSSQFLSQPSCDLDIYLPSELDSEESLSYQSPEMLIRLFQINTPSSAHRAETHLFDPLTDDMQALSVLTDEDYSSMNEEDFNTTDVTCYPWEQSTVVPHIPSELQSNYSFSLLSPPNSPSYSNKIDVRRFNFIDEATGRERRPFLYEFIRLLLDDDDFSHIASYVDRKHGVFKLHKPKEIAQLWKQVKGRNSDNKMTYDKLARAIRYYYRSGIMHSSPGRFTFRFGIKSGFGTTWWPAY